MTLTIDYIKDKTVGNYWKITFEDLGDYYVKVFRAVDKEIETKVGKSLDDIK